jgi:hypothetical protein
MSETHALARSAVCPPDLAFLVYNRSHGQGNCPLHLVPVSLRFRPCTSRWILATSRAMLTVDRPLIGMNETVGN